MTYSSVPRDIGYHRPRKTMNDVFNWYRQGILGYGPYRQYFNSPARPAEYTTGSSPERRRPEWSEGERKEHRPETPQPKTETKPRETEHEDTRPIEKSDMPSTLEMLHEKERRNYEETHLPETSGPRQLPVVELGEGKFFLDEKLHELRNVEKPWESISFKDLDLVPEKTGQYNTEKQADVKEIFGLPKYEDKIEFGQTDIISKKRPSPEYDSPERRW
ncbi:MAG: hypothetical protein QW395_07000 [Candidatus Nitrosotenuis sp.]